MQESESIIEMSHVTFRYGGTAAEGEKSPAALRDVSLRIGEGEFVGVIGPSGAGKSTLASVLSGAIPHHFRGELFGSTLVDGRDTCDVTLTGISQVVGSVLQDIDAQMVASVVEDELLFGLENFGVPHDQIEDRIARTLDTVGIVLDEPTAALDPASSALVFDTLRKVREEGVTVVVIEQKVALLSEYCDRILVMGEGSLVLDGTPREVFAHADELRRIGVDSPRVARVYNSLARDGLVRGATPCLTVPEAAGLIGGLVGSAAHGSARAADDARDAAFRIGSKHVAAPRPHAVDASPVVSLKDVSFAYPGGTASVDHLDMRVYPGEVVGIVGQNGAGKTTLTKLLNGLLRPASGTVRMAGLDTREVPTSAIAAHCATLFQNPDYQLCKDTVLDEVAFGLTLQGVGEKDARERAAAVIARFGLPSDEAPFSLSRGQRQMVALASVVVTEPEVVLLDEPTSGLDYRECMTVMDTVSKMAERGCAVIMVCHDMEVVSDFAERIVVMADGRILDRGGTQQMFGNQDLMRRASVRAPQVIELSQVLARTTSPEFAGISQVSGIVDLTEEMVRRG